jgi:uroporphyrinogen-III decarboxylase
MVSDNSKREYNTEKLAVYNNPSFIKKMMELFIKSAINYSDKMYIAVAEKNILQINQLAHFIKPSIDLLSINSINNLIREVEMSTELNNELTEKINFIDLKLKLVTQQMQQDYINT